MKRSLFLLTSLAFLLLCSGCSFTDKKTKPFLVSGKDAFGTLPKQPILLHFWSSWCRLCLSELSAINSLNEVAEENGVLIVTVATNDSIKAAMNIHRTKLTNTIVIYDDGSLEKIFRVPAVPFTIALATDRNLIPLPVYPSGRFVTGINGAQPWGSAWGEKIVGVVANSQKQRR